MIPGTKMALSRPILSWTMLVPLLVLGGPPHRHVEHHPQQPGPWEVCELGPTHTLALEVEFYSKFPILTCLHVPCLFSSSSEQNKAIPLFAYVLYWHYFIILCINHFALSHPSLCLKSVLPKA